MWTGIVSERLFERVSLGRYRLLAAALGALQITLEGKVAFVEITQAMVKAAKANWEDSEGIVNYARTIDGVECGVLLASNKGGGVRVSMRSKGHVIDAGAVCARFGGGGHRGAAGCLLEGDMAAARTRIEQALAR
jgi:phosphoesterase RecJ-like protein